MSCLRALFVGQCYGGGAEGGGALRSWDLEFVFWTSEEMVGLDFGIGFLMMELGDELGR
jgi:hypothetical protein